MAHGSAMRVSVLITLVLACVKLSYGLECRGMDASWPQQYVTAAMANTNSSGVLCVQLSSNIALQYVVAGDSIMFDIEARLPNDTAYLGIGLSQLGSMKGADMAILHNTAAEAVHSSSSTSRLASNRASGWWLVDSYASGFVQPVDDDHQDLKLVSLRYSSSNSTLRATWIRPLVPCDDSQDLPLAVGMPVHIIWAYGSSWAYHGPNRGGQLVKFALPGSNGGGAGGSATGSNKDSGASSSGKPALLMSADPAAASTTGSEGVGNNSGSAGLSAPGNASGLQVLDLVFPVDIPAQETTYRVMYFKLPDDRKYHILKYEPVVNHPMLHHGVAYACLPSDEAAVEALTSLGPYDRLKQGMLCEQFFMMLATNMTPWEAPAAAALPFGVNSTRYIALELHYNNPQGLTGQRAPGSGIRVHYTPELRQHDMGVLTLGQFALDIPPGIPSYPTNVSVCPASCTSRLRQPVQLVSGFFHMHGLGKDIIARHFRDGRELTPLGHLMSFDYGYQNTQDIYAPDAKVLLPGDALTVQCTFDSTSRTNVTTSGPGTRDEMCFYWISYWPAQPDMGYCMSFGGSDIAGCGADIKTQTVGRAFEDKEEMAGLIRNGTLLQFPGNPAVNSTPYTQACSNLTAV